MNQLTNWFIHVGCRMISIYLLCGWKGACCNIAKCAEDATIILPPINVFFNYKITFLLHEGHSHEATWKNHSLLLFHSYFKPRETTLYSIQYQWQLYFSVHVTVHFIFQHKKTKSKQNCNVPGTLVVQVLHRKFVLISLILCDGTMQCVRLRFNWSLPKNSE